MSFVSSCRLVLAYRAINRGWDSDIKTRSSSEKKIQLAFILLYWYAENRLRVELTVNKKQAVTQAMGPL